MNPIGPGGNRPNVSHTHEEKWKTNTFFHDAVNILLLHKLFNVKFHLFVTVPNGTWAWRANGSNGSHGATSHEWITRWVKMKLCVCVCAITVYRNVFVYCIDRPLSLRHLLRVWGYGRVAKGEWIEIIIRQIFIISFNFTTSKWWILNV